MIVEEPIIKSLLDSDFYKFTMQQLVLNKFPTEDVSYQFINRGMTDFPDGFDKELKFQIQLLSQLKLTTKEKFWLRKIPYIRSSYIEYLSNYRFNPEEVIINQQNGHLQLNIKGKWCSTILFEVPLMAIISELYFKMIGAKLNVDWEKRLEDKSKNLQSSECAWSDFGTRRRYSFLIQDGVVEIMKGCDGFLGTSNPYLAIKHNVKQIGTAAHEFIMGMAGLYGVSLSNEKYLSHWKSFYGNDLSIALTDTYTTEIFLRDWNYNRANSWSGLRQDSGNCEEWASKIINHYNRLGVPTKNKTLLFSDNLDDEKYKKLSLKYRDVAKIVGGIGTNFSNYCSDKNPLNMVIKLTSINGINVVKLSDDVGKNTGNSTAVESVKKELELI